MVLTGLPGHEGHDLRHARDASRSAREGAIGYDDGNGKAGVMASITNEHIVAPGFVKPLFDDVDVFRTVVVPDAVDVVNPFAVAQLTSEFLFGHQAVFVNVSANVGPAMRWPLHQHVAIRCGGHRAERSTARSAFL